MKRMLLATLVMMTTTVAMAQDQVMPEYPMEETVQPIPADSYGGAVVDGSVGGSSCGCNGGGTVVSGPVMDSGCGCGTTYYDYGYGSDCCSSCSSHGRMFGGMGFRGMRSGLFSRNRCCCY